MFRRLINWFRGETELPDTPVTQVRRRSSAHASVQFDKRSSVTASEDDFPEQERGLDGHIENLGPGKNVLVRKKYVREESGTYETLKIIDDSIEEEPDVDGIDPYNSGQFDRSRHWDRRFRD